MQQGDEMTDSVEKAGEKLRLALQYIGKFKIPMTPQNYSIWYEFAGGANKELNKAIDEILKSTKDFPEEVNVNLYNRFIADSSKVQGEKALKGIRKVLASMSTQLTDTGGAMSSSGDVVGFYAKQLKEDLDTQGVRLIVEGIVNETEKIISSADNLKSELDESTKEVELLRKELDKVKEEAATDPLTGLPNRGALEQHMAAEIKKSANQGTDLSMLIVDIDFFKKVNDNYGHLVGDDILRQTATHMNTVLKGVGIAARYGGEEFVALLPNASIGKAREVGEKLRKFFEVFRWKRYDNGKKISPITISIGASTYRIGEDKEEFIKRADDCLYKSKEGGRNRLTIEDD